MFKGCSSLDAVTCLATDISAGTCTTDWLYGVASSGTLTVPNGMEDNWTKNSSSGCPTGWNVCIFGKGTAAVSGTNAGRTSCGWVQLWENGPKFAEFNVGATISSYGSLDATVESYSGWVAGYNTANVGGLYPWHNSTLNGRTTTWDENVTTETVDVATSLWGDNWQEPTRANLNNLRNYDADGENELTGDDALTVWTWCSGEEGSQYVSGCTLAGYKVSGKEGTAYENNNIFLPVTGYYEYYDKKILSASTCGVYWSSDTYNDGHQGYNMGFESSGPGVAVGCYQYGYSVRVVLVE